MQKVDKVHFAPAIAAAMMLAAVAIFGVTFYKLEHRVTNPPTTTGQSTHVK